MSNQLVQYDPTTSGMDLMTLGQTLAKSGYFQDTREAAQAVVKVLAGAEMGIGPIQAMTGIYIVKGRVTLSANLMAAQIKRSGKYDYRITRMDDAGCTIVFFQGSEQIGESTFDEADAKAAGLLSGDNWRKFPRNMYFARAMSNGAKWYTPDIFSGPVYTPDELSTSIDGPEQQGSGYIPPAPAASPVTGEVIDNTPLCDICGDRGRASKSGDGSWYCPNKHDGKWHTISVEDGLFPEPAGHVSDTEELPL